MSTSIDALLAFGYDLGGDDSGWKLRDAEPGMILADFNLSWYDENQSDDVSIPELITLELQEWQIGQTFITAQEYVSYDYPRTAVVITSSVITYRHGAAACNVSPKLLESDDHLDAWNAQLKLALDHLGLKPAQPRAEWLLMSFWG